MSPSSGFLRLVFVAFIVIQAVLWSHGRYGSTPSISDSVLGAVLKRSIGGDTCAPLSVPIEDQCAHVMSACSTSKTVLSIPYVQNYFCTEPTLRPLVILLYIVYVLVVIIGSWWEKRQFRKRQMEAIVRGEYAEEEMPEPYRDDRECICL